MGSKSQKFSFQKDSKFQKRIQTSSLFFPDFNNIFQSLKQPLELGFLGQELSFSPMDYIFQKMYSVPIYVGDKQHASIGKVAKNDTTIA